MLPTGGWLAFWPTCSKASSTWLITMMSTRLFSSSRKCSRWGAQIDDRHPSDAHPIYVDSKQTREARYLENSTLRELDLEISGARATAQPGGGI